MPGSIVQLWDLKAQLKRKHGPFSASELRSEHQKAETRVRNRKAYIKFDYSSLKLLPMASYPKVQNEPFISISETVHAKAKPSYSSLTVRGVLRRNLFERRKLYLLSL